MVTLTIPINEWLEVTRTLNAAAQYEHVLVKERNNGRAAVEESLRRIFREAHEDARRHIRRLAGTTLDPLGAVQEDIDPSAGYPELLALSILQGYTGEIIAGIFAENIPPGDSRDWRVPAFVFRFHHDAFRRLPHFSGIESGTSPVPGRTGEDCLAFQRQTDGSISAMLACEAKCILDHDIEELHDAHSKAAQIRKRSFDLFRLIEVLSDDDSEDAAKWTEALRALSRAGNESTIRSDQVTYVCGRSPVQRNRRTWASTSSRSQHYNATRGLQCIEFHLIGIEAFIRAVFSAAAAGRAS